MKNVLTLFKLDLICGKIPMAVWAEDVDSWVWHSVRNLEKYPQQKIFFSCNGLVGPICKMFLESFWGERTSRLHQVALQQIQATGDNKTIKYGRTYT